MFTFRPLKSFTRPDSLIRLALVVCLHGVLDPLPAISALQAQLEQPKQPQAQPPQPQCVLGNDTFKIGERWNPVLEPFGVQVCVLCECTIRQRKSCYEAKTSCRKITNECPIIESCPDGKLPATVPGQCCKSCVTSGLNSTSSNSQMDSPASESIPLMPSVSYNDQTTPNSALAAAVAAAAASSQLTSTQTSILAFRILYDERTKDYLSMVKTLMPCPSRDVERLTSQAPTKTLKKNRNDLNGVDSKLAFKSLQETVHDSHSTTKQLTRPTVSSGGDAPSVGDISHDHQHPNDVQPTGREVDGLGAQSNGVPTRRVRPDCSRSNGCVASAGERAGGGLNQYPPQPQPNMCILGNDTFHIGDIWHPIIPQFGVQECVLCNCIVGFKRNCYEAKVICKRLDDDCPKIDYCSDGLRPVKVEGQCCESCPVSSPIGESGGSMPISNLILLARSNSLLNIRKNETTLKEFKSIPRAMQSCLRRESGNTEARQAKARRKRRNHRATS